MLDQEGGDDHPHPVMHPAGPPELAHPGIDDRHPGPPALPGGEVRGTLPPGHRGEGWLHRPGREIRRVPEQIGGEFAPDQLLEKGLPRRLAPRRRRRVAPDGVDRDLPPMQVRRQARGAGDPRQVALAVIIAEAVGEKGVEPRPRPGLARRPARPQPAGPVGLRRQQPPVGEPLAARIAGGFDPPRCRDRRARRESLETGARERRIDAIDPAGLGGDPLRAEHQRRAMAMKPDPRILQRSRHAPVGLPQPGLVRPPGMNRAGANLPRQRRDDRRRIAPPQHQPPPARGEIRLKGGERMVQPPA